MCLYVMKRYGFLLNKVIHQTPEICKVAIQQCTAAKQFVKIVVD